MIHCQNPDPLLLLIGQPGALHPEIRGENWGARDDGDEVFQFPSQSKGQEFQRLWTLGTLGTQISIFI
ncbi:hypothetical protein ABID21_000674 [Pseudorhizobium tarimense]|uniref:Uncharacterized protein n=1 Tax=Pseudorhizobium tarimense TaxID=1079109 RepID=A0ABV2H223_9HYPH